MEEGTLIRNGRLTVSLFHGTSTLFYDSILESGLGGRNAVEDFGIRAAARLLVEVCDTHELRSEWPLEMDACDKIAADPKKQDLIYTSGFSFRYGGAYVSPSQATAIRYALLNDCGSEALACTLKLLRKLSNARPDLVTRCDFSIIGALAQKPRKPLVIEARDIEVGSLRAEQGGGCNNALRLIEDALTGDPEIYDLWLQQANFELVKPAPPHQLRFYEVMKRVRADGDHPVLELFRPNHKPECARLASRTQPSFTHILYPPVDCNCER